MKQIKLDFVKRIAIFSDIHWGKSKDNIGKLSSTIEYLNWFIDKCKINNVDIVIFGGDWFDNRNSISITTMNIAYKSLEKLAKVFPTYIIVGNHDTTLKNTSKIHSLISFNLMNNVNIIDEMTELQLNNCRVLLSPWNTDFKSYGTSDILIGHFEFNGGIIMAGQNKTTDFKYGINDLCAIAPLVYSGHFHIHKEYPYNDRKVVSVGSTIELDWGDYNNEKGFYIYDTITRVSEFIKNDISPVHVKYYYSKIKDSYETSIVKKDVKHNYIKIIVDQDFNYNHVLKIVNYVNSFKPIKNCEIDFMFNILDKTQSIDFSNVEDSEINMTKFDYIKTYIAKMKDDMFENISREVLIEKSQKYFNLAENELMESE